MNSNFHERKVSKITIANAILFAASVVLLFIAYHMHRKSVGAVNEFAASEMYLSTKNDILKNRDFFKMLNDDDKKRICYILAGDMSIDITNLDYLSDKKSNDLQKKAKEIVSKSTCDNTPISVFLQADYFSKNLKKQPQTK